MALVEGEVGVYCQGVCRDGRKCSSDAEMPEFLALHCFLYINIGICADF